MIYRDPRSGRLLHQAADPFDRTGGSSAAVGGHALLSASHTDTLAGGVVRGSLIIGNATPLWAALPITGAGIDGALVTDGTDVSWASTTTDGHFLQRVGGIVGFDVINLETTTLSGVLPVSRGGSGLATLTDRAVILGRGTADVEFASPGTAGLALVSAGAAANPVFGAINLDAASVVSGTLAVANGGTNLSTIASGALLYASALDTIAALVAPGADGALVTDGSVPSWATTATDGHILRRAGTVVGFGTIDLSDSNAVGSSVLTAFNGGTGLPGSGAEGDMIYGDPYGQWQSLVVGAANEVLTSTGTVPDWAKLVRANTGANTGTGDTFVFATSPTFVTDITTPLIYGGTASGGDLDLESTSHATKGQINLRSEFNWRSTMTTVSGVEYGSRLSQALAMDNAASELRIIYLDGAWTTSGALSLNAHRLFYVKPSITNVAAGAAHLHGVIALDVQPTYTAEVASTVCASNSGVNYSPTVALGAAGTWNAVTSTTAFGSGFTTGSGTWGQRNGLVHGAHSGAGAITTDIAVTVGALKGATSIGLDVGAMTGGTLCASVRSAMTANGSIRWCLRSTGDAPSLHVGNLRLGDTTTPTALLDVIGKLTVDTNGVVTRYNNIATVSNGVPSILAAVNLTAQSAALTGATLYTPATTGMFRVSFAITLTRAATTSSTVGAGVNLNYTTGDGATAVVQNVPMWIKGSTTATVDVGDTSNTIGTTLIGSVVVYASTAAMTYDVGYTSSGATTMQYACRVRVEAL